MRIFLHILNGNVKSFSKMFNKSYFVASLPNNYRDHRDYRLYVQGDLLQAKGRGEGQTVRCLDVPGPRDQ